MKKTSIKQKVVDSLIEKGMADKARVERLFKEKEQDEKDFFSLLISDAAVKEKDLVVTLSELLGVPPIDIKRFSLDENVMKNLNEKLVRRYGVLILSRIGNSIVLVTSDPTDILAIDDIKSVTGCDVELVLASASDINDSIEHFYSSGEEEARIADLITEEEDPAGDVEFMERTEEFDLRSASEESNMAPIVKMVDLIIAEAIKKRASDIHVEPEERILRIRYRIDGRLHTVFELPKKNQNAIIARLKIMSNLDITETRVPQDGRFRIRLDSREIDFRVSILPTTYGNKVVLRALDKSNLSIGLESLGFLPGPLEDFNTALSRPFGIILVTGPTGSGKSTTLYSILNKMNTPGRNIVTVEDPVEYQVPGITQIAAKPEIGLDFAQGLRAILRQSPDVILVGEIRDYETADTAIKASLTGQMVLSTLHTNDSVGAITRLINMGIEPFLVSSSLVMACAQRLLRRICPNCKTELSLPDNVLAELTEKYPEAAGVKKFYHGKGCARCNDTGYKGRMATLETLLVDETIREMINTKVSEEEMRKYLIERGVRTLRDNAMIKFFRGMTTLEEVMRVT
jgi:type IV pilus assembly protein PilB